MSGVRFLNPAGMHRNPAFSQVVTIEGPHRMVYVGGQNAVSAEGEIIGKGDIGVQGEQVALNLKIALEAAGARPDQVIRWTVHAIEGQPVHAALAGFRKVLGSWPAPPTISVLFVAGLAHPDFLLEVEALAAVPL